MTPQRQRPKFSFQCSRMGYRGACGEAKIESLRDAESMHCVIMGSCTDEATEYHLNGLNVVVDVPVCNTRAPKASYP